MVVDSYLSILLLLILSAFILGSLPFSLWIGKMLLHVDIRGYGDANPGAANVFKTGKRKAGILALVLDIGKGCPIVWLSYAWFGLPEQAVFAVGLSAMLGNAFSPFLHFKGGKSIAVMAGVFAALPEHDMFFVFLMLVFLGFLFIEVDAWTMILSATGTLIYCTLSAKSIWAISFMAGVMALLVIKHIAALKTLPRNRGRLLVWIKAR